MFIALYDQYILTCNLFGSLLSRLAFSRTDLQRRRLPLCTYCATASTTALSHVMIFETRSFLNPSPSLPFFFLPFCVSVECVCVGGGGVTITPQSSATLISLGGELLLQEVFYQLALLMLPQAENAPVSAFTAWTCHRCTSACLPAPPARPRRGLAYTSPRSLGWAGS